jgi:hypothetical protein
MSESEMFDMNEVEAVLKRQDEAMALLERLRDQERDQPPLASQQPESRREFRRWPAPDTVTLELHDGESWAGVKCTDMGVGGAKVGGFPAWAEGPTPARLRAAPAAAVLVLADVMWQDRATATAGLRFEFFDNEERDRWAGSLLDALLAAYSVG